MFVMFFDRDGVVEPPIDMNSRPLDESDYISNYSQPQLTDDPASRTTP
jgi:hypothetical protein